MLFANASSLSFFLSFFLSRWWSTVFSSDHVVQESVYRRMPILFIYHVFDVTKVEMIDDASGHKNSNSFLIDLSPKHTRLLVPCPHLIPPLQSYLTHFELMMPCVGILA